jgi:hypothetical protein
MDTATPTATPTTIRPTPLTEITFYRAWRYDDRPESALTDDEIDKAQWVDPDTNLDCLIVRSPAIGNLCGYVGVGSAHPAYGVDYNHLDLDAHGGLTYADRCQEGHPHVGVGVCHVPFPGRSEDIWWLGFDCAHSGDRLPWSYIPLVSETTRYRDQDYVAAEVTNLAAQLGRMR